MSIEGSETNGRRYPAKQTRALPSIFLILALDWGLSADHHHTIAERIVFASGGKKFFGIEENASM
jgi:hypothetical protein